MSKITGGTLESLLLIIVLCDHCTSSLGKIKMISELNNFFQMFLKLSNYLFKSLLHRNSILFYFFNFYFILLYNTILVLPYIDVNPPRVYMSSQSWTPLPPPTPYHLSGSSLCTSPKHPVSCIEHRLAIHFLPDSIRVLMTLFNMLSRLVITFLPRSKCLLISWLQSPSAVILDPPKIKSDTVSTVSPSISHEVMRPDV